MPASEALTQLVTIRDFIRYGIRLFNQHNLNYGHGVDNVYDEACWLIYASLQLPDEYSDTLLDARLLTSEKKQLLQLFEARIRDKKPTAYLLGSTELAGFTFLADERALVPRSHLAGLLCDDTISALLPTSPQRVLDLCTGGGSLAIIAQHIWPDADITAVDICPQALSLAQENQTTLYPEIDIDWCESDLFAQLSTDDTFDVILTNPPYVTNESMANLPEEYRWEPVIALAGGARGSDLVRRILHQAAEYLNDNGILIVEIGSNRAVHEEEFPNHQSLWLECPGDVFALTREQLSAANENS